MEMKERKDVQLGTQITANLDARLTHAAEITGMTKAEIVRRALDSYLPTQYAHDECLGCPLPV